MGERELGNNRFVKRTSLFKRLFVAFSVFLLIFSGLPVTPSVLTPVTKAADSACSAPIALRNGGFEGGAARGGAYDSSGLYFTEAEMPPWKTTDDANNGVKTMEVWNRAANLPATARNFPVPPDGIRWAELNAFESGMLYQDVATVPGQTIYWRLSHMGRAGVDTMQLRIGKATANPYDTVVQRKMSDGKAWGTHTGSYTVPAGQTVTRFGFEAVSTASESLGNGNFLDDIFLGTAPCVTTDKTVAPSGDVTAGTELTYAVNIKNTGGDIAANMSFADAIPIGTEYVPRSMILMRGTTTVNLTDAADTDAGNFNGSQISVRLGDLPNASQLPNGITVQFKVRVLSDYTVKKVSNKAQISYGNLLSGKTEQTETNETTSPVLFPELESSKTAVIQEKASGNTDAAHAEAGDTLLYTIQTRNTVANSAVSNLVISDTIPAGLEYVPGSLSVDGVSVSDSEGDDRGHYTGGQLAGQFGKVTDTAWHAVTFRAKVLPGQAGDDILNTAVVGGDNVEVPDTPGTTVKVYPRAADLVSSKTAVIQEKASGNTDTEHAEVGDTLLYTIQTRNTIADSVVTNLTLSDTVPAGLEYIPDSLIMDGASVTDSEGDDAGHYADRGIVGRFGDVTDTAWHTVAFRVKVLPGQAGKDILNTALVVGDNVNTPDKPGTTVEIYPRAAVLESNKTAALQAKAPGNTDAEHAEVGDTLEYTIQTRNTTEDSVVENLTISDTLPAALEYVPGSLIVDGVSVSDSEGDDNGHYVGGQLVGRFDDVTDTAWHTVTFRVKVLPGQAGKDIPNTAVIDGDNVEVPDRPGTTVEVYPRVATLESSKTASILEKASSNTDAQHAQVGDTLLYTIQTRNTTEDSVVENLTISDVIPAGLEYMPGSLTVDGASVSDSEGDDRGHYASGGVVGEFGDVMDTVWHTVTFQAKVLSGQTGKAIPNTAVVAGDNVEFPDRPGTTVDIYPRGAILESSKTSEIQAKASGNTDVEHAEVGDTLLYTIQTRNTIEESVVTNLTISDTLPAELEYVSGSLTVDGVSVSDSEGDDRGYYASGRIVGQFGDITDLNWHTVQFKVVVQPGQAGKEVINIAEVNGGNVETPARPREEVEIYPRNPVIESEKSVTNVDAGKATYEVGDTLSYTIRTRAVVNDTYLENLTITDTLPAGLEYVPGSLKVDGMSVTDAQDNDGGHSVYGQVYGSFGNVDDMNWHMLEFQVVIQTGYDGQMIQNTALVTGDNIDQPGEPTEKVVVEPDPPVVPPVAPPVAPPAEPPVEPPVDPQNPGDGGSGGGGGSNDNDDDDSPTPVLESEKAASDLNGGVYEVGDIIEYTIRTRNTIPDSVVTNLEISDALRAGLEYVPGFLQVDGQAVTDVQDSDKGSYVDGTVSGQFGDVGDTDWHTVVFRAKLLAGQSGQTIRNTAEVTGDNLDDSDTPTEDLIIGSGSGSNPGIPGDPNDGSSGNPSTPGWGGSDSGSDLDSDSPDSDQPGESGGSGGSGQSGTSDNSGDSANGGSEEGSGNGSKLPATATNMYGYLLAGFIILLAGLFLLRRKKA
ncbi:isopeptide-forming domain-containing fimbrial protein [Paenibacillus sp. P96]|uniref:Isopeptide-forming domain-containing fimbrial protein n=1 Tax=Paenibacillus zeirhizosphaerae TaxID=2987519 RepID=A0ABT9FUW1_9BACL|nr:isopeptide-forming domain-containing fimbrial protein [Paenibacillus sp. P96]MDP4098523.1 isopeptide-forming domain-containing fimbrial protein [Paenibacillus sp. P96]